MGPANHARCNHHFRTFSAIALLIALSAPAVAQFHAATAPSYIPPAYSSLRNRPVEDVRILGNERTPTSIIQNVIRTRTGDKFDPATVEQDYRAIYGLKKFANVEAKIEPTALGVIVTFIVTEQKLIGEIRFRGNRAVDDQTLTSTIDIHPGEAIDS